MLPHILKFADNKEIIASVLQFPDKRDEFLGPFSIRKVFRLKTE